MIACGTGSQLLPWPVAGELNIHNRINTDFGEAGSSHRLIQNSMNWPHLLDSFCLRGDLKQYKNYCTITLFTIKIIKIFSNTPSTSACPGRFVLPLVAGKPETAQSQPWIPGWGLGISRSRAGSPPIPSWLWEGAFPLSQLHFTSLALCLFPESQKNLRRDLKVQLIPSPGMLPDQRLRIWMPWENWLLAGY